MVGNNGKSFSGEEVTTLNVVESTTVAEVTGAKYPARIAFGSLVAVFCRIENTAAAASAFSPFVNVMFGRSVKIHVVAFL